MNTKTHVAAGLLWLSLIGAAFAQVSAPIGPGGTGGGSGGGGGGGTPCTSTALSLQYNAAGSFGCVSGATSNGTALTVSSGNLKLGGATSGTITVNAAAIAGTNTLTFPAGTTDFSATGGTSFVVRQSSAGAALTVSQLACANLSDAGTGCSGTIGNYLPLAGGTMTGGIGFSTTNTLDIGTNATTLAPRTVYAGTSFVGPVGTFTTSVTIGAGSAITSSGAGGALGTAAFVATGTSGATLGLLSTANTAVTGQIVNGTLRLGTISSVTGQLLLANSASANLTTIQAGNAAAARTYTWPTNFGAAGTVLTDAAGDGTLSWAAAGSTLTLNSTATSGFTDNTMLKSVSNVLQQTTGVTHTATGQLTLASGTVATSTPFISATQTANTTGAVVGYFSNIIPGASVPATTSKHIQIQYNSADVFSVARGGSVAIATGSYATGASEFSNSQNIPTIGKSGAFYAAYDDAYSSVEGWKIKAAATFQWSSTADMASGADLFLRRVGAASLGLGAPTGSGAAVAQTFSPQGSSGNSAAAALFTIAGSDQTGTTTTGGGVKIRGGNGTSAGGTVEIWTSATTTPAVALAIAANKNAAFTAIVSTGGYAIASLPTGVTGARAYVTDQITACAAIGIAPTAGGALTCPVFFNGTIWVGG